MINILKLLFCNKFPIIKLGNQTHLDKPKK